MTNNKLEISLGMVFKNSEGRTMTVTGKPYGCVDTWYLVHEYGKPTSKKGDQLRTYLNKSIWEICSHPTKVSKIPCYSRGE